MKILRKDTEQRLLKLFDRGDATAMDELYAEYADYLTGVCYRYIGNADDMKDVLQEAFIKIFMQIGSFRYRGSGSLKAWMTRIVINEALMFLRDKKRMNVVDADIGSTIEYMHGQEDNDESETLSGDNSVHTSLPLEESWEQSGESTIPIFDLISQLPTGYRTVFNLFAIDGLSHKQIAAQLGIAPSTSASQFYKARTMLARMIKDYRIQHGQEQTMD